MVDPAHPWAVRAETEKLHLDPTGRARLITMAMDILRVPIQRDLAKFAGLVTRAVLSAEGNGTNPG